ncbi:hypothetical protein Bhyg_02126 [Pseudolycoriella hygida]|uniref:Uncharacterized protein n=1 Tax=Pseudolycoriella hygida TaxID=35572 RepID=A0A9Q0S683_9DIPT|nr:hypothetical protein Bhyg_02126 [Pseudolycoriella hygida]
MFKSFTSSSYHYLLSTTKKSDHCHGCILSTRLLIIWGFAMVLLCHIPAVLIFFILCLDREVDAHLRKQQLPLLTVTTNVMSLDRVEDLVNLYEAIIPGGRKLDNRQGDQKDKVKQFEESIVHAFKTVIKPQTYVIVDSRFTPREVKMLRIFGREIKALRIYFNMDIIEEFERAICNYCCETVSSITFFSCMLNHMRQINKPFENVESIRFYSCHIGNTLGQLQKWFPRMHELQFIYSYVANTTCIHDHFPEMKSLYVCNGDRKTIQELKRTFTNSDLKIFSLLNPQLKHLNITHDMVDETWSGSAAIIINYDLLTFISKNLKLETLTLNLTKSRYHLKRKWPSTVTMEAPNYGQWSYETLAAFVVHAEPKRLAIIVNDSLRNVFAVDKLQFFRQMPQLLELFIKCSYNDHTLDAIITLLTNCDTLEKITLFFNIESHMRQRPLTIILLSEFSQKFSRNIVVARKWAFEFEHKKDMDFEQYCFSFQKQNRGDIQFTYMLTLNIEALLMLRQSLQFGKKLS